MGGNQKKEKPIKANLSGGEQKGENQKVALETEKVKGMEGGNKKPEGEVTGDRGRREGGGG